MKIQKGNLEEYQKRNPDKNGWIIGHFVDPSSPFYSGDFEVKYFHHSKGDKKKTVAKNNTAKTLSILISGKFAVYYPDSDHEDIILEKPGDYEFHDAGIYHTSEALEKSVILTIRWPSLADDQVSKLPPKTRKALRGLDPVKYQREIRKEY